MNDIYRSLKLNKAERIKYLEEAINIVSNLRYARYSSYKDRNIVFDSSIDEPIYTLHEILDDIIMGIELRVR